MYISLLKFLVTVPRNTIKNFSLGLQSQVQESQALILRLESQLSEEEVHIRNFDVIVCDFGLRLTLLNLIKAKVNFLLA